MTKVSFSAFFNRLHFCRVFTAQKGITLMDYVQKRRLSVARTELTKGKKIIDVAVDYGYETAGGFAKSFNNEFGYSPTAYAAHMSDVDFELPLTKIGGYIRNPVILKKEAFKVAGYGIKTNVTSS
jgi:Adenosine deaminase